MDDEWAAIREPAEAQVWREVIRPLAAELHGHAHDVATGMVQLMQADLPDVMPDAEAAADNEVSTEETLRSLAQMIERDSAPEVVDTAAVHGRLRPARACNVRYRSRY